MIFLQGHGVSPGLGAKIYRQYGKESVTTIRENPYLLERDVQGVGFRTADALAVRLGLPRDGLPRYMTGMKHVLSEAANADGHCYLEREDLLTRAAALFEAPLDALAPALDPTRRERGILRGGHHIYLAPFFYAESGVARRMRMLRRRASASRGRNRVGRNLRRARGEYGLHLAERQRDAVRTAYRAKVCVLTGGPGVGKTTAIRALLDALDKRGVDYALAAPTGRAAKRMSEATGRPASTLHRLLNSCRAPTISPTTSSRPLPQRFIIVDEVSMLDVLLAYRLVRAVHPEAHLLLVGDADQLPSVGPGSVFADCSRARPCPWCASPSFFARRGERHHRHRSWRQFRRHALAATQPTGDFFFLRADDPTAAQRLMVDLVARRLPQIWLRSRARHPGPLADVSRPRGGHRPQRRAARASESRPRRLRRLGDHTLRTGDKVMQVRNNYDKGAGGVFNGDLGRIVDVCATGRPCKSSSPTTRGPARHLRAARA